MKQKRFVCGVFLLSCFLVCNSQSPAHGGALHDAAKEGDLQAVKRLLADGTRVDVPDSDGRTPLHHATANAAMVMMPSSNVPGAYTPVPEGYLDLVKLLVSQGADVNGSDRDGRSPLHLAASIGTLDVVRFLVSEGANWHAKDSKGKTARDYVDMSLRGRSKVATTEFLKGVESNVVYDIQRRLKERGYEVGTIDGILGPATRNALRLFQKSIGLPETGDLDTITKRRLIANSETHSTLPDVSDSSKVWVDDIDRVLDIVIATCLRGQLAYSASLRDHELTARLQKSTESYGTIACLLSNKVWIGMNSDGISMSVDEDWVPLKCSSAGGDKRLPTIELGTGEMGLKKMDTEYVETYVKDGTRVRIDGRVFVFRKGWKEEHAEK